ncbi:MAG: hypothetical protein IIB59_00485 [Planctomycetes bacterium]|nr:hypothetical protein [Planctomycetota bacterium]
MNHTTEKVALSAGGSCCVFIALLAGCIGAAPSAIAVGDAPDRQPQHPFVDPATLNAAIPTPQSVVGHTMGDGAIRYEPLVRYLHTLADASPLVTLTPYATSHEGRTLYYLTITSVDNHARLDAIKADNAKLADPRTLGPSAAADTIIDSLPGIAWLAYSIHGDELSSTDAAVQLAYQLAAGKDASTKRLREQLVIHIDPLMNPDGRERYLSQLQHLTGKVANTDHQAMQHSGLWSAGRGNHYFFDMNRDWLMLVQPETRGRVHAIGEWNPHLVVDSHEMGSLDTYLFDPPRRPFNVNISEANMKWRRRFSADQAKAFDHCSTEIEVEDLWCLGTRGYHGESRPGPAHARGLR